MKLEQTIKEAQQGNARAFEALYGQYRGRVLRYLILRGVPQGDAEELCDDVFLTIWRKLHLFRVNSLE